MITIKNTNKIVNYGITAEWYVEEIKEMWSVNADTLTSTPLYIITIRNRETKYFEEVHLYRVKGFIDRDWYELSCIREGDKHTQYLAKEGIANIKILLYHIKIVGID